jgi:hypothetical protein
VPTNGRRVAPELFGERFGQLVIFARVERRVRRLDQRQGLVEQVRIRLAFHRELEWARAHRIAARLNFPLKPASR